MAESVVIVIKTHCTLILTVLCSAIPIAMIWIGATHVYNCSMDERIPIFMMVAGVSGLLTTALTMCAHAAKSSNKNGRFKVLCVFLSLISLFNLCWHVVGSVWVFTRWKRWRDVKDCHGNVYLFCFAVLVIFWIAVWIALCLICGGIVKGNDFNNRIAFVT